MTYEYDFFLSFPRSCSAGEWVVTHFYPLLQECFHDECQSPPKIYCFTEQDKARYWPQELENALARSKFLLAVFTPPYFFRSKWCQAEFATMKERERLLGWGSRQDSRSLIFPVLYSGADALPEGVNDIRGEYNLTQFGLPDKQFRDANGYMDFRERLRQMARELDSLRRHAPKWDASWPVIRPDDVEVLPLRPPTLPKL
jgi:hypothetical protein